MLYRPESRRRARVTNLQSAYDIYDRIVDGAGRRCDARRAGRRGCCSSYTAEG